MTTYPYMTAVTRDEARLQDADGFSIPTENGESYFVSYEWQRNAANDIADCFRYTRYLIRRDVVHPYMSAAHNTNDLADNGFCPEIIDGIASHVLQLLVRTHDNLVNADDLIRKPEESQAIAEVLTAILIKEPEEGSEALPPTIEDQTLYTLYAVRKIFIEQMEALADAPDQLKEIALSRLPFASEDKIRYSDLPVADILGDVVTATITSIDVCLGTSSLFTPRPTEAFNEPDTNQEIEAIRQAQELLYNNLTNVIHTLFPESPPAHEIGTPLEEIFLSLQEEQIQQIIGQVGNAMFPSDPNTTLPIYRAGDILSSINMRETTLNRADENGVVYEKWAKPETPQAILAGELEVVMNSIRHNVVSEVLLPDIVVSYKKTQGSELSEADELRLIKEGSTAFLTPQERDAYQVAQNIICRRMTEACNKLKRNVMISSGYVEKHEPLHTPSSRDACRHAPAARLQ